jgi:competence protein ComEC
MPNSQRSIVICVAYILGLLVSFNPWSRWGILALGIPLALLLPRWWPKGPTLKFWAAAIAIALCAGFYSEFRVPQPAANDISRYIPATAGRGTTQFTIVQGTIESYPRVTRNHRAQFWLEATQLNEIQGNQLRAADVSRVVSGKVYVTVPLVASTSLQPGVDVTVTGTLYLPPKSQNPGGFNFQDYLYRSGSFAGMRGNQLHVQDEKQTRQWSWGKLRQQIVAAQVKWLDIPAGPLVSAMVMGADAVDVPFELRDRFVRVGLAHALAASGFQVSLLLNAVLALTKKRFSLAGQFNIGGIVLLLFLGLTGMQPAVARSVLMGFAVLIALRTKRQINPLNSLLIAATILLIIDPLTIWDIGFQLSVLATLGLIITVKPIEARLDRLPPTIAGLVSVPLAAMIWTLPLQLYVFKVFPLYSLAANIITAPLIEIISIGGMISAAVGTIIPIVGSATSSLLYYPTHLLIGIVNFFNSLPGTSIAVGRINTWQLIFLYGLIGLVWFAPRWQKLWKVPILIGLLITIVPLLFTKVNEFQITALSAKDRQVLVVQDRGRVMLINSGDPDTARFVIMPFLQQQAVNQIDLGLEIDPQDRNPSGWKVLTEAISLDKLYRFDPDREIDRVKSTVLPRNTSTDFQRIKMAVIEAESPIIKLNIDNNDRTWAIVGNLKLDRLQNLIDTDQLPPINTLYWLGTKLTEKAIIKLNPQVAISAVANPDPETVKLLDRNNVRVYYSNRDGAIQWTPTGEFTPYLEGEKER